MVCKFVCAIVTRLFFIVLSLISVWRVAYVKNNYQFWLLSFLCLPLIIELIIGLKKREGQDYRWFSPAILLFLLSTVPSIWILELQHQENKSASKPCLKLNTWDAIKSAFQNETTTVNAVKNVMSRGCPDDWILGLHQALLILLILGKWVLPRGGGVTRDELSQLLLIFVGTAADILEFSNETLSEVKGDSSKMVYAILGVWSWSMLQFPPHLAVVNTRPEDIGENGDSVLMRRSTDIWVIMESLLIQDGPFLIVRIMVIIHYRIFHQMLFFFAFKNLLVVILNVYRLIVICRGDRDSSY